MILDQNEKEALLENAGIDHLWVVPFTIPFSELSADEYVKDFLIERIQPAIIVMGYDHKFGKGRTGDFSLLKEIGEANGIKVIEIPKQLIDDTVISSTQIRNAVLEGNIKATNELLGYSFFISGKVVEGDHIGREIGFPTANIQLHDQAKIIPGNGVYAVKVIYKGRSYDGMLNIGMRPTVSDKHDNGPVIEVNIFDFNETIYGEALQIDFIDAIRKEKKFSNLEKLRLQLEQDQQIVKQKLRT